MEQRDCILRPSSTCVSIFSQLWEDQNLPWPCSCSALRSSTQVMSSRCLASNAHTALVFRTYETLNASAQHRAQCNTLWPTQFIALSQRHKKPHGFDFAHTRPVWSAGIQNLCLPPNDGTVTALAKQLSLHIQICSVSSWTTKRCLILHKLQLAVSQRCLAAEANRDGIGHQGKKSVRGMFC